MKLVEIEPGRWRVARETSPVARSALPCPMVISDAMLAVEHVDGRIYESKAAFREVTRAHGLTEVGTEKFQPKTRSSLDPAFRQGRRKVIKTAIEKVKAGHYERYFRADGSRRSSHPAGSDDT
jgi:hypothetical protein